jgi:septum formation topological specificity factor MinE
MKNKPFHFYTQYYLVQLLGIKARNPEELLKGIKKVPESSIYYHTHKFLQQHLYLSPEPPNDFGYWTTNVINLKELGEAFTSIDTISFKNLEDLRKEFIRILENYIKNKRYTVSCPEGQEFHFMSCKTFVFPTKYIAYDLKDFMKIIGKVSINSLYLHIFEARLRKGINGNDFSEWFKKIGKNKLAKEVTKLDPYTITLEGLREKILGLVSKYA